MPHPEDTTDLVAFGWGQPRSRWRDRPLSVQAQNVIAGLRSGTVGPVLSMRTWLMNCKFTDLQGIFEALLDCESVHMLSIGRNDALATSVELADLLARVLRRGFVWACDWGEIHFRYEVMERLLNGLSDQKNGPSSNLAFVFADVGCGVTPGHVDRLKQLTRARRLLDKTLPPERIDRTHGPWLQAEKIFGWLMRSENITRCFWRPYQEADFWRRAGFSCIKVVKPDNALKKWVNPGVRPYNMRFHRGDLDAHSLQSMFPPGHEGERRSQALLAKSLHRSIAIACSSASTQLSACSAGEARALGKSIARSGKAKRCDSRRHCSRSRSPSVSTPPMTPELLSRGEEHSESYRDRSRSRSAPTTPPDCVTTPLKAGRKRNIWKNKELSVEHAAPSTPPALTGDEPSTPLALTRRRRPRQKKSDTQSRQRRVRRTVATKGRVIHTIKLRSSGLRRLPRGRIDVASLPERQEEQSIVCEAVVREAEAARQAMAEAAQEARARRESAAAQRAIAMREVEMEALLQAGVEADTTTCVEAESSVEAMLAEVINEACFAPVASDRPLLKRKPPKRSSVESQCSSVDEC